MFHTIFSVSCLFSVNCPLGTYYSLEHSVCESCLMGSYQDEEGQLECKPCPTGTYTEYLHSRSGSECKGRGLDQKPEFYFHLGNLASKQDEIQALPKAISLTDFFLASSYKLILECFPHFEKSIYLPFGTAYCCLNQTPLSRTLICFHQLIPCLLVTLTLTGRRDFQDSQQALGCFLFE